jgi:integrase
VGLPWPIDETNPKSKHAPKIENRRQKIDKYAVAAIRLLILTGARLREILHAKWEYVDFERHMIRLPASKTGKKTIYLSAAAEAVLASLNRIDDHPFVFPGEKDGKPRADLNKPWRAIIRAAKLDRVRAHDLRHSFASFGAGKSLGLPIIGKLLGHTQAATTARYAHGRRPNAPRRGHHWCDNNCGNGWPTVERHRVVPAGETTLNRITDRKRRPPDSYASSPAGSFALRPTDKQGEFGTSL